MTPRPTPLLLPECVDASMYRVPQLLGQEPRGPQLRRPCPHLLARAEHNINFAWLAHFVYDAGFLVLDFLQAVRGNESRKLDLLWREFFASAHTGTANKTQYVPMSIMRVFWGMAMTPELDALYHRIRTIPTGDSLGCNVGWDMACELLNVGSITVKIGTRASSAPTRTNTPTYTLEYGEHDGDTLAVPRLNTHAAPPHTAPPQLRHCSAAVAQSEAFRRAREAWRSCQNNVLEGLQLADPVTGTH